MLVPLSNSPRDYAWGSSTLLADLTGRIPSGDPEAEIWFGDHPGCPSIVEDGSGRTLDVWLREQDAAPLPYLVKLLAAGSSLSIQAHPSKAEAVLGFAREEAAGIPRDAPERLYRDDNHKPEIIVAVSDTFRALVGLRPLAQTRRLVAALGPSAGPAALTVRLEGADEAAVLRATLAWLLSGDAQADVDDIIVAVRGAVDAEFAAELTTLRRIADDFPGDPGVVVALLMNHVELRQGEGLFAPAGALHAYQDGLGLELMAASDNVLRGGLTPKHIDVAELLRIVDTTPGPAPIVVPRDGMFDVGIPDFALTRLLVDRETRVRLTGPAIVVAVRGAVEVAGEQSGTVGSLGPGAAAYAGAEERELAFTGSGEVFIAQPGRR
ncbi:MULTISPECIES: mannose-6-phosphate isomerase, class I [unclassified Microbacterium]|uniref:mannose-6-phosphate isomerase, class I n=1 Tax=unclassified Microbacterium TaxID=2609290 RepID=UPI00214C58C8|nr:MULTISPECIES: mannose-6-phosphate isomerase, class I [unclassified Microbacterium]MCR2785231.1 mannose-6-phosphate isomerase, class I [Microbacterium sp. zg.B96]MDL5352593.1 mannose-6-phosphate isomerase, class I [Microbacterium sp. zg-YB36]WIM16763.1 mannose-6-phosphate isomerase, class I [Microbacterium sp. zg-B96]